MRQVLVLSLLLAADSLRIYQEPEKADGPIKIMCVGDSITQGQGLSNYGESYPSVLERILNERTGHDTHQVSNLGEAGSSVLSLAPNTECNKRADLSIDGFVNKGSFAKAMDSHPDIITIMFGANDDAVRESMGGGACDESQWERRVEEDYVSLVQKFQTLKSERGTKPQIYLLTPPPIACGDTLNKKGRHFQGCSLGKLPAGQQLGQRINFDRFPSILKRVQEKTGAAGVIDIRPKFTELAESFDWQNTYSGDGVHPTKPVHDSIAELIFDQLKAQ